MTTLPRLTVTPADVAAPPKTTAQVVVEQTAAVVQQAKEETIAGVDKAIKAHVNPSPRRRSGWRSTATWLVLIHAGLCAGVIVKAKDVSPEAQNFLLAGLPLTIANHGWNSRKLKTTSPSTPRPHIFTLMNKTESK